MEFELRNCIYPLFKAKQKGGDVEDLRFLGTCFFVQIDKWVVMITAKHNLNTPLISDEILAVSERVGDSPNMVGIEGIFANAKGDISFLHVETDSLANFKRPLHPLKVLDKKLKMGHEVSTFGFPFTQTIQENTTEPKTIIENNLFLKGYINSIVEKEFISDLARDAFEINYYLSFFVPEGMSGAPLLARYNDEIFAAGIVYGNHEVQYQISSWEETQSSGVTEKHVNYRQYEFGISSTFLPFEDIKSTLTDIEKRVKIK